MLCQHCQKRVANVHFTQIVNSNKVEMYLCEQCAKEKGKFGMESPMSIQDLFSGFIGFDYANPYIKPEIKETVCEKCGMSFEEFQKNGKLGCGNCYEVFAEKLGPLLKRLHGNVEHHGKAPKRVTEKVQTTKELEKLRDALNKAIQTEEYERAAQLRDQIRMYEAGTSK
ncbi:MAG: UvrB/UvrC motif-containing protein [Clostridia bacterium]|nr:UvrB/UvrC motif-containing protein [Clostridia bacterium]